MPTSTTRPDNFDNTNQFAPWNQDDYTEPVVFCSQCRQHSDHYTYVFSDEPQCDTCLLANAKMCGDYGTDEVAALLRVHPVNTDTPTHAGRACINALDIIVHANRQLDKFSGPRSKYFRRIELMEYFLDTYGYREREEEAREFARANVDLALSNFFNTLKP
jgi:hypothetical protein